MKASSGKPARKPATHDLRVVGVGALLLTIAGLTRTWLRRKGKFDEVEASLHQFSEMGAPADAERVAELVRLLRKWDQLAVRTRAGATPGIGQQHQREQPRDLA